MMTTKNKKIWKKIKKKLSKKIKIKLIANYKMSKKKLLLL